MALASLAARCLASRQMYNKDDTYFSEEEAAHWIPSKTRPSPQRSKTAHTFCIMRDHISLALLGALMGRSFTKILFQWDFRYKSRYIVFQLQSSISPYFHGKHPALRGCHLVGTAHSAARGLVRSLDMERCGLVGWVGKLTRYVLEIPMVRQICM